MPSIRTLQDLLNTLEDLAPKPNASADNLLAIYDNLLMNNLDLIRTKLSLLFGIFSNTEKYSEALKLPFMQQVTLSVVAVLCLS